MTNSILTAGQVEYVNEVARKIRNAELDVVEEGATHIRVGVTVDSSGSTNVGPMLTWSLDLTAVGGGSVTIENYAGERLIKTLLEVSVRDINASWDRIPEGSALRA